MRKSPWNFLLTGVLLLVLCGCGSPKRVEVGSPHWKARSRQVHSRFRGRLGTFAQFGDSITVAPVFWSPLRKQRRHASPALEQAFQQVNTSMRPECWEDWKGPEFGSAGGKTSQWAKENVDSWLRKLNPEVAVILFGTNDLRTLEYEEYRANLRAVVQRCQSNGTVPILTTPPPRHGREERVARFAQAVRELARELETPLVDFHAEILKRRPNDWDGTSFQFRGYASYDVPTLIGGDGIHPSYPTRLKNDYSPEALRTSGFTLRNSLTLLKYAELLAVLRAAPRRQLQPAPKPPRHGRKELSGG